MSTPAPPPSACVAFGALLWLLVAFAAGAAGVLRSARPPMPQLVIGVLTAALLVLFWTPSPVRRWALQVDVRRLVLIHVTRLVAGGYFLILYGRGELPYAFAVPGGWGDIAVAVTALAVCWPGRSRNALLAWNVFGTVDILLVVATAARLGMADPESMRALLRLPLSLLPTFLVPIIIATHVIIFARLGRR